MKNKISLLILILSSILLCSYISFAAVASTYLPRNPVTGERELKLGLGETGNVNIYPQNTGNQSIFFYINITIGKEYLINEIQEVYEIPPDTLSDDYKIEMFFMAPKNASIGDVFSIEYRMASTTDENKETGMVGIAPAGFIKRFDIVVVPEKEKEESDDYSYSIILLFVTVILVLSILLLILIKRKRKK